MLSAGIGCIGLAVTAGWSVENMNRWTHSTWIAHRLPIHS
jgi:hypothetical protein